MVRPRLLLPLALLALAASSCGANSFPTAIPLPAPNAPPSAVPPRTAVPPRVTPATRFAPTASSACVTPVGIDDATPGALKSSVIAARLPKDGIFPDLSGILSRHLDGAETAIRFHRTLLATIPAFNAAAAFHASSLDFFGRETLSEQRRRCLDGERAVTELHRRATLAYALAGAVEAAAPDAAAEVSRTLFSWGLPHRCPGSEGCATSSTPWGMGHGLAADTRALLARDGWNADGSLSRESNRVAYEDFREKPYMPMNSPWNLSHPTRWQPLPETLEWGRVVYQDHAVPHAGIAGRSYFLGDKRLCALTAPDPNYDYPAEMVAAARRVAALDERGAARVRLFDAKHVSIIPLARAAWRRGGRMADSFEGLIAEAILAAALYEGVILVWKEKVRHDAVRPPSAIRNLLKGTTVPAAAGGTVRAEEWAPLIRTMPHSENPSGSACVCRVFSKIMEGMAGSDSFRDAGIGDEIELTAPGGDLEKRETFAFKSFSEAASACSQSRLDGGLHFEKSVPAGEELCSPIAEILLDSFEKLKKGDRPAGMPALRRGDDETGEIEITIRKC